MSKSVQLTEDGPDDSPAGVVIQDITSFLHSYLEVRAPYYSEPELVTVEQFVRAVEHHLREVQLTLHSK